ncbi:MAG: choice-of-anchor I family protein [Pseudomonadota bacterium]|nr:choice-of-anchor I family protein [Pseudomonadota bacterium]
MKTKPLAKTLLITALASAIGAANAAPSPGANGRNPATVDLTPIGSYATGFFDEGAAEIVAHDPATQNLYVVNAQASVVEVLNIRNPAAPAKANELDVTQQLPGAGGINSVAVKNGLVAIAVENDDKQANGWIAFYSTRGQYLGSVEAGALPDMVTFTPDGRHVLSANEGEPNGDYSVDPEGSVTIVTLAAGRARTDIGRARVSTASFPATVHPDVRITGPLGTTVPQDLEPEYITTSADSKTAWVSLQENNALAIVDIRSATVLDVVPLGAKDHSLAGNGIDASDRDGAINIQPWPVKGLYMPDAIAAYVYRGMTYVVSANEGDAREYGDYVDVSRVKDLTLDHTAFPDRATLRADANLGRLNVINTEGDIDDDGDFDELYSYGARSISIWNAKGSQVYDSGDTLEQLTAARYPDRFNASNTNNSFDNRSDDKGPEPEGLAIGTLKGRQYAFVGLERTGGIMVFDITNPAATRPVSYVNNRDFTQSPDIDGAANPAAGDLGPEGLIFIDAKDSPNRKPLLVVGNEISGTTTVYQVVTK